MHSVQSWAWPSTVKGDGMHQARSSSSHEWTWYADNIIHIYCILNLFWLLFVGLNISEVAHDHQVSVKKFVTEELGVLNSYDTWHGIYLFFKLPFNSKLHILQGRRMLWRLSRRLLKARWRMRGRCGFSSWGTNVREFISTYWQIHLRNQYVMFTRTQYKGPLLLQHEELRLFSWPFAGDDFECCEALSGKKWWKWTCNILSRNTTIINNTIIGAAFKLLTWSSVPKAILCLQ